jgi:hypothetical protein
MNEKQSFLKGSTNDGHAKYLERYNCYFGYNVPSSCIKGLLKVGGRRGPTETWPPYMASTCGTLGCLGVGGRKKQSAFCPPV